MVSVRLTPLYENNCFYPQVDDCEAGLTKERAMRTWMCLICGWIYDEESGLPEEGIAAGTTWEDVPPNWVCPECGARKEDFEMMEV